MRAVSGPGYRAAAYRLTDGSTLVVAIPLTEVTNTLGRLSLIAGAVTLAVLATLAILSLCTVQRGLRPFEQIEADRGGDRRRRPVASGRRDRPPHGGRAARGLAQRRCSDRIEEAMDERRASEEALAAVPGRRLARAAHPAHLDPRLRRAVPPRRLERPDDTALAMRRIEQEGERMGVLVEDLLFLARAGQGRPIAHEPVDLSHVAVDAIHDARAVDPSARDRA